MCYFLPCFKVFCKILPLFVFKRKLEASPFSLCSRENVKYTQRQRGRWNGGPWHPAVADASARGGCVSST